MQNTNINIRYTTELKSCPCKLQQKEKIARLLFCIDMRRAQKEVKYR